MGKWESRSAGTPQYATASGIRNSHESPMTVVSRRMFLVSFQRFQQRWKSEHRDTKSQNKIVTTTFVQKQHQDTTIKRHGDSWQGAKV